MTVRNSKAKIIHFRCNFGTGVDFFIVALVLRLVTVARHVGVQRPFLLVGPLLTIIRETFEEKWL